MKHRFLWFTAAVIALGGFLFGYDWVVIGGAKPFYEAYFGIVEPAREAWAMSCALVGCLAGAVGSGMLSEQLGRKRSLLVAAAVFAVSSIGTGAAYSFSSFVCWRIGGGLAIGMASALSPLYIAEIAPAEIRGKLVCLNELTIVLGILAAQVTNALIAKPVAAGATLAAVAGSWNGQIGWRWMFAAAALPALVFLVGTLRIPESPRWLGRKGLWTQAEHVLAQLGGPAYGAETVAAMRAEAALHTVAEKQTRDRAPMALTVGVVLAVLQQWCGINVIFNYAQEVFASAGYGLSSIFLNSVLTGVVMCVFTFLAIASVERLGRRWMMLLGCFGLVIVYVAIGGMYRAQVHGWPVLLLVVAAIACYAMTLAPVTWVILSEIFPNHLRGAYMAISTAALWVACFVLTFTFPLLNAAVGLSVTFWIYAGICAAGGLFVARFLPETEGRALEEMEVLWQRREAQ